MKTVESRANLDTGRKVKMKDSDSWRRIAERSNNSADAVDCNYIRAASAADSVEDSCISAIGRSAEDCRGS